MRKSSENFRFYELNISESTGYKIPKTAWNLFFRSRLWMYIVGLSKNPVGEKWFFSLKLRKVVEKVFSFLVRTVYLGNYGRENSQIWHNYGQIDALGAQLCHLALGLQGPGVWWREVARCWISAGKTAVSQERGIPGTWWNCLQMRLLTALQEAVEPLAKVHGFSRKHKKTADWLWSFFCDSHLMAQQKCLKFGEIVVTDFTHKIAVQKSGVIDLILEKKFFEV